MTVVAGNAVTDEQGRRLNIDGDEPFIWTSDAHGNFSLKDVTEIRVNVRGWCLINGEIELMEEIDATE